MANTDVGIRIKDLPTITEFTTDDSLIVDNGTESRQMKATSVQSQIKEVIDQGVDTTVTQLKTDVASSISTSEKKIDDKIAQLEKEYTPWTVDTAISDTSTYPVQNKVIKAELDKKQDTLVSGTNIKTINGGDIVGSGNVDIVALPTGGVKGNLLYKKSTTDGDAGWTDITTDNLLTQDNIVDDLTSTSTTSVLSANQGKVLNDKFKLTQYSNIEVSATPTAISGYQPWDTDQKYGYSVDVVLDGITNKTFIQNIVMTDSLTNNIAKIITTELGKITLYTTSATALSGTILSLFTQEVE